VVLYSLFIEQLLQFRQLCRILRGEIIRFAVILIEVVKLPLVILPMPGRQVLPPWQRMLGRRDPAMVIDCTIGEDLEVLPLTNRSCVRIPECACERNAVHRLLLDTVDGLGRRYVGDVKDRGDDIDQMRELSAHAADILNARRPRHDHRVSGAAQM